MANRSAFLDGLQLRLNKKYLRSKTALLSVNIKGLKAINARVGQHAGDEVIRLVSKRIMVCVGNDGVGARISGNEFSVILVHSVDPAEICGIAEKISRSVKKPFAVFGKSLHVSASVGVAIADNNSDTSDQLLKQAEEALSAARSSANSHWKVYSQKLENKWMSKVKLTERLREAVANNEFTLDYQPQYSLEKDEIVSFEALLRWVPSDVPVPETNKLIQWLENSGLIKDVGNWVLATACSQFTTWKDIGLLATGCTMSVNIAPSQLMDSRFPEQIATILKDCRMSAHQLNLGIAEASLDEDGVTAYRVVNDLKEMGVKLSLSAFGMGKSSINRINRLPIDALKIDCSFVMAMETHEPSHTIVMSVLALANTLDIDVVADGIESSGTLGRLKAADCKLVQGDHISKAKSAAFLEPMLVRRNYKAEDMIELS